MSNAMSDAVLDVVLDAMFNVTIISESSYSAH
ncbi:hypothetical protein PABG_12634 [Paracoccidioides brasiliensis Pb03]|nr:hypothetical protein PABG_12634 [Paracoccidioides brasiliensis Pb03]